MLCSKCAANLPDGSHFCLKCGQPAGVPVTSTAEPEIPFAVLGCTKCGADLPDGAEFCPKCGKPVSVTPIPAGATRDPDVEVLPPEAPRPRKKRRIAIWVFLALLVGVTLWITTSSGSDAQQVQEFLGMKHDQSILDTPFSIAPHNFRYYKFSLPEGSVNVSIVGDFSSTIDGRGASRKPDEKDAPKSPEGTIEVYVLSEPAFTVWQNGYATSSVYESGRVADGSVQAVLPAGAGIYYLVFSNKFDQKAAKSIHASVLLRYKSWLPDSIRRGKDRFWNWLGL